jgi:hypothetical protein
MFFFDAGATLRVGRKDATPPPDVRLAGLSIQAEHATIKNEGGVLMLLPGEAGAKITVNGDAVTGPVVLHHLARVIFGATNVYKVVVPAEAAAGRPADGEDVPEVIDYAFAMGEGNRAQMKAMAAQEKRLREEAEAERVKSAARVAELEAMMKAERERVERDAAERVRARSGEGGRGRGGEGARRRTAPLVCAFFLAVRRALAPAVRFARLVYRCPCTTSRNAPHMAECTPHCAASHRGSSPLCVAPHGLTPHISSLRIASRGLPAAVRCIVLRSPCIAHGPRFASPPTKHRPPHITSLCASPTPPPPPHIPTLPPPPTSPLAACRHGGARQGQRGQR